MKMWCEASFALHEIRTLRKQTGGTRWPGGPQQLRAACTGNALRAAPCKVAGIPLAAHLALQHEPADHPLYAAQQQALLSQRCDRVLHAGGALLNSARLCGTPPTASGIPYPQSSCCQICL